MKQRWEIETIQEKLDIRIIQKKSDVLQIRNTN